MLFVGTPVGNKTTAKRRKHLIMEIISWKMNKPLWWIFKKSTEECYAEVITYHDVIRILFDDQRSEFEKWNRDILIKQECGL